MTRFFKIRKHSKLLISLLITLIVSKTTIAFGIHTPKNFPHTKVSSVKIKSDKRDDISENIKVDCAFSVGGWCICAHYLEENKLRTTASPIDWMRAQSLDGVAHLFETKFVDFFTDIKVTNERRKKEGTRTVYDNINHVESIHYMPSDDPFDEAYKEFKETMDRRSRKVDKMISSSKSILLVNCRHYPGRPFPNSTDKELKDFALRFAKAYPNLKKIYLIDIHNDTNKKIIKKVVHSDKKIRIIQYKFRNIDNKKFFPPFGNAKAWNKILKNVKLTSKRTEPIQEAK